MGGAIVYQIDREQGVRWLKRNGYEDEPPSLSSDSEGASTHEYGPPFRGWRGTLDHSLGEPDAIGEGRLIHSQTFSRKSPFAKTSEASAHDVKASGLKPPPPLRFPRHACATTIVSPAHIKG